MVMDTPHDDLVLIRTSEGQDAAFDDIELDAAQRRLLLVVNGFTPLSHLIAHLGAKSDWPAIAGQLLERGLVAAAGQAEEEPEDSRA